MQIQKRHKSQEALRHAIHAMLGSPLESLDCRKTVYDGWRKSLMSRNDVTDLGGVGELLFCVFLLTNSISTGPGAECPFRCGLTGLSSSAEGPPSASTKVHSFVNSEFTPFTHARSFVEPFSTEPSLLDFFCADAQRFGVSDGLALVRGLQIEKNGSVFLFVSRWAPDILQFANQRPDFAACQSWHQKR